MRKSMIIFSLAMALLAVFSPAGANEFKMGSEIYFPTVGLAWVCPGLIVTFSTNFEEGAVTLLSPAPWQQSTATHRVAVTAREGAVSIDCFVVNAAEALVEGGARLLWSLPSLGEKEKFVGIIYDLDKVITALRVLSGIAFNANKLPPDINGDGKIGMEEVIFILQKNAGLR